MADRKTETLTLRLDPGLRARVEDARAALPYSPTMTSIVERGLVLAIEEMERIRVALNKGGGE